MSSDAQKKAPDAIDDPVLQALACAPLGPADPSEVRAAMREAKDLGRFVPGAAVSAEIARRQRALAKPGK